VKWPLPVVMDAGLGTICGAATVAFVAAPPEPGAATAAAVVAEATSSTPAAAVSTFVRINMMALSPVGGGEPTHVV
jgi:hypothetical protein